MRASPVFPRRVATTLRDFPHGCYLSDLHLASDVDGMWAADLFRMRLGLFARGEARLYQPSDLVPPDRPGRHQTHIIRVLAAVA